MPGPYCYDYPRPAVTVDLVVFALEGSGLRTLLIQRGKDPFAGRWALPGGFLDIDEPIEAAARREFREETGLEAPEIVEFLGVFGDPGRDPRGRTISLAHAAALRGPIPPATGGDDASDASWIDPRHTEPLAFDHNAILTRALTWLSSGVKDGPVGLALLPTEFSPTEVRTLLLATGAAPPRSSSTWLRRQERSGRIVPLDPPGSRFRLAQP